MTEIPFDPTFDTESDGGSDPDKYSARLHAAHLQLWSRALPSGQPFDLTDARPSGYLLHNSALGTFDLRSDSIIHTYRRPGLRPILNALNSGELDRFVRVAYMIGGYTVLPVGHGRSLNQVRGFDQKSTIDDRFDLTLECIRLHYEGSDSPLADTLDRYQEFFRLFGDFRGYVNFFLFQDLVDENLSSVQFFLDGGFDRPPLPQDVDDYRTYSQRAVDFVLARNARMIERITS